MNFDIFEEYLSNNLKVNDDKVFQEKIELLSNYYYLQIKTRKKY